MQFKSGETKVISSSNYLFMIGELDKWYCETFKVKSHDKINLTNPYSFTSRAYIYVYIK